MVSLFLRTYCPNSSFSRWYPTLAAQSWTRTVDEYNLVKSGRRINVIVIKLYIFAHVMSYLSCALPRGEIPKAHIFNWKFDLKIENGPQRKANFGSVKADERRCLLYVLLKDEISGNVLMSCQVVKRCLTCCCREAAAPARGATQGKSQARPSKLYQFGCDGVCWRNDIRHESSKLRAARCRGDTPYPTHAAKAER